MKVLVLGGAGRVAQWVIPHLAQRHDVTTFDRVGGVEILGDALSPAAVCDAMIGQDAVLHLCSVVPRGDDARRDPEVLAAAWATNVGSVHVALEAARRAGIRHFVYASSMSVFADFGRVRIRRDAMPDSNETYGFSKRAAEFTCAAYGRQHGLHVTALRLSLPTPDDIAPLWWEPATGRARQVRLADGTPLPATPAKLVAESVERALTFTGAFQAVPVVADGLPWA